jgi:hypothetical protein
MFLANLQAGTRASMSIGKNLKCNPETGAASVTRDIVVDKGHVRRALRAAEIVFREAAPNGGKDNGVVLMTAVLLVERLAISLNRDPLCVLDTMARCFDFKRKHVQSLKRPN